MSKEIHSQILGFVIANFTLFVIYQLLLLIENKLLNESRQGLWNISCEEAIQLAYKALVVLLRCLLMPDIMDGQVPVGSFYR